MKWQDGKEVTFRGCAWDAGWEFDAPWVMYAPVKRYGFTGSICQATFENKVEDVMIDLCIDGEIRDGFSECDLKEFKWRGWSPRGFARRTSAKHFEVRVRMEFDRHGETSFSFVTPAASSAAASEGGESDGRS